MKKEKLYSSSVRYQPKKKTQNDQEKRALDMEFDQKKQLAEHVSKQEIKEHFRESSPMSEVSQKASSQSSSSPSQMSKQLQQKQKKQKEKQRDDQINEKMTQLLKGIDLSDEDQRMVDQKEKSIYYFQYQIHNLLNLMDHPGKKYLRLTEMNEWLRDNISDDFNVTDKYLAQFAKKLWDQQIGKARKIKYPQPIQQPQKSLPLPLPQPPKKTKNIILPAMNKRKMYSLLLTEEERKMKPPYMKEDYTVGYVADILDMKSSSDEQNNLYEIQFYKYPHTLWRKKSQLVGDQNLIEQFKDTYGHVEQIQDEWRDQTTNELLGYKCKFKDDPSIYEIKLRYFRAPKILDQFIERKKKEGVTIQKPQFRSSPQRYDPNWDKPLNNKKSLIRRFPRVVREQGIFKRLRKHSQNNQSHSKESQQEREESQKEQSGSEEHKPEENKPKRGRKKQTKKDTRSRSRRK